MGTRFVRAVFMVAVCCAAGLGVATAAGPADIHDGGDLHESVGQGGGPSLQRGVVYQATAFALALRVRPPDAHWLGVQHESGSFRFVQLHHLHTGSVPLQGIGDITIEAATGSTPSAATAIRRLHSTPHIDATPIKPARVAGFAGETFDATIVGTDRPPICRKIHCASGISFAPFTENLHCGFCNTTMKGETKDVKFAGKGEVFRIFAFDVRGKAVVIYLETVFADQPRFPPSKVFPTFVPYAQQMLSSITF